MIGTALTEDDAFQLYRGWSVVPEEKKPLARAKMEAYLDERAANGEPLWPRRQAARERVEVERMEKLWLTDPTTDKPDSMMVRQIDFISSVTRRKPHEVAASPHYYRRQVAGYFGNEAAAESPEAFDALARGFVQKQRERRLLLSGNGNPEDVSNGGALEWFAADAARYNRPVTDAWAEWSRQSSVKPGFADAMTEGEGLFTHFQRVHERARQQWEGFGERADGILRELEARTNDGSPTLDTTAALPFLDGLTPPQRDAVLSLVVERAKAKDKSMGQQTGEAVGRVFARLAEAQTDSVSRVALSAGSFREGQTVPASLASNPAGLVRRQVSRTQATVGAGMFGDVSGMAGAVDGAFAPTAALTKEQADAASKEIARQREAVAVESRLRDVATGAVDPVKGSNWFTDHVYYPALNVAGSIGSFAAPGGWAANLAAYVEDEQSRLEAAGVSPEAVMVQAPLVGGVQAAMDRLQLGLLRKLPALSGVAERLTAPAATGFGAVAQRLPGALATAVGESGVESAQQAFPLVTQKVFDALGADEPDVSWDAIAKETWAAAPDTFFGFLPLVMLGAGVGSARDYKNVRSLVGDASALREVGFDDAQITRITKAGDAEAMVRALKTEWGGRTPVIGPAASPTEQAALDVVRDPLAPAGEVAVAAKSRAKIETTRRVLAEIQQAAGVKSVRRTAAGWSLENEDGTVTVGTPEEVRSAMIGMGRARSEREAGAMMSLIDYFATQDAAEDVGSVTSVNAAAQVARMGADGKPEAVSVRTKADGTVDVETLAWKPETLANLAAEMRAAGVSEASILGMNSALADDSGRLVRAYQTNAGADIRTILHERFERLYREGRVDEVGVIEAANILAALPQFDPARMRDPSQRKVAESLRRIALEDESVTAAEKRETLVDLVVADVLGRWQDGTKLPAGAIEAGILEASMVGMSEEQQAAMGTFRGVWRAVKAYLKGMFGIASRIAQARRKGQLKEGDGWTDFVDNLLGVDAEKAHVEAVVEEVDAETFSLGVPERRATYEATPETKRFTLPGGAELVGPASFSIRAYHGTPHKVDRFSLDRIGTGEGTQFEGYGLYFTGTKGIGEWYRDKLSARGSSWYDEGAPEDAVEIAAKAAKSVNSRIDSAESMHAEGGGWVFWGPWTEDSGAEYIEPSQEVLDAVNKALADWVGTRTPGGNLYTVELDVEEGDFLDWDRPLSEQGDKVKKYIEQQFDGLELADNFWEQTGRDLMQSMMDERGDKGASQSLSYAGIKGVRYLDGMSRKFGEGSYNYVIFDDRLVRILEENGTLVDAGASFSLSPITPENRVATEISGVPAADIFQSAKQKFGVTKSLYEAGYVLPDGTMLDFSGRSQAGGFTQGADLIFRVNAGKDWMKDQRGVDHREIEWDGMPDYKEISDAMVGFLRLGAIRIDGNSGMISMHSRAKPTAAQISVLKALVVSADGAYVDLEDDLGNRASLSLESGKFGKVQQLLNRWAAGETPEYSGITFSLGSVNTLEAIAARLEERVALGGAVAKLETYQNIARNLEGMARAARANEDTETILSLNKIEAQRRELRKKLEDEYVGEVWAGPLGGALSGEAAVKVAENDFLRGLLKNTRPLAGRFMPLSKALKQGANRSNYEYAKQLGLPGWLFRGDVEPDVIAQELGMDVDEMWDTVSRELASVAGAAADLRKAQVNIQEAKQRARDESRAWASSERARMAASDKRDESRTLITLDAILAQLPAEVRGRVGGFTKLSQLKANDVRRKHFLEMIGKIDVEMERYLRRSYLTTIRELFTKSKPKRQAGEKDRGRLGVNAHAWIEKAEEVSKWDETKLEERADYIEERLSGAKEIGEQAISDLTRAWDFGEGEDAARIALEQESAILDLFGGLSHYKDGVPVKGSGEMEAALMALRATIETGRLVRESELMRRRADRETRRLQLQSDSGNAGKPADIKAREDAMQGFGGDAVKFMRKGFSLEQFIGDLFGRGSNTHRFAEDTVMEAELSETARFNQAQSDLSAFLRTLWPRTGRLGRIRNLEAMATPRPVPGAPPDSPRFSQLEAVHMTMLWSDMDSRDWLTMHGFGEDMQTALEAYLTPEAKAVRTWLQEWYDDQYDDLNEVYRRIHGTNMPRVRNYSPRMVEHGKDAVSIDPLGMGGLSARGVFAGFTKRRRPTLSAAPVLADALQAWAQNQRVVTHFLSWAEASSELRAVFSTSATATFIKAAGGKQAAVDLNQWLSDLEAGGVADAQGSALWKRWLRANTADKLFGKLGVLAKQIPAAYGSAAEVGWSDWLKSARRVWAGEAARTRTEAAQLRIMQGRAFNRPDEFMQAARGRGADPVTGYVRRVTGDRIDLNAIDVALREVGSGIGRTDAFFTSFSAAVAYDARFREAKESGDSDDAAHAYAERETERVISRTAQPETLANKSLGENHLGTWGRILFMFQSANRQALYMTAAAFRDGGMKSGEAWRKAVMHWALTGLVTQTVGNIVRDLLTDDDEEEIWEVGDYLRAMTFGPLTGMLHAGPIIDAIASLLGGFERRQGTGPAAAITDLAKAFYAAMKDGEEFDWRDGEKVARSLGLLLGGRFAALNVSANMVKQLVGAVDNLSESPEEAAEREKKAKAKAKKEAKDAAQ
jgi:hypothetical protein